MKYFSLFSGVGGFEIAIKDANECVGSSEIDKYASQVLKYRFPETKNYGDITKIDWSTVPDFDLLVGGSPCQDLSVAGKQKGLSGERSGLFFEYIRCLKEKQPAMFIWENVKGALSSSTGWDFARVQIEMAEVGYDIQWQVLNAKDFGVPQNRERVFAIGHLAGTSAREVFFERSNDKAHSNQDQSQGSRVLKSPIRSQGDKPMIIEDFYPNRVRVYGDSSPTLRSDRIGLKVKHVDRKTGEWHVEKTKTAGTITATMYKGINADGRTGVAENNRIRRLTPTECERLMSWPDSWTKYGINDKAEVVDISDSQRYKMCGNGVVSKVIEQLISSLFV